MGQIEREVVQVGAFLYCLARPVTVYLHSVTAQSVIFTPSDSLSDINHQQARRPKLPLTGGLSGVVVS